MPLEVTALSSPSRAEASQLEVRQAARNKESALMIRPSETLSRDLVDYQYTPRAILVQPGGSVVDPYAFPCGVGLLSGIEYFRLRPHFS